MPVNSDKKGKRAERALANYLIGLGYPSARRGQQHKGGGDSPDVIVDELPNVHIECKWDQEFTLQSRKKGKSLAAACKQAAKDAGNGKTPVVFWKRNGIPWRLTYQDEHLKTWPTMTGDGPIKRTLEWLNSM